MNEISMDYILSDIHTYYSSTSSVHWDYLLLLLNLGNSLSCSPLLYDSHKTPFSLYTPLYVKDIVNVTVKVKTLPVSWVNSTATYVGIVDSWLKVCFFARAEHYGPINPCIWNWSISLTFSSYREEHWNSMHFNQFQLQKGGRMHNCHHYLWIHQTTIRFFYIFWCWFVGLFRKIDYAVTIAMMKVWDCTCLCVRVCVCVCMCVFFKVVQITIFDD